MGKDSDDRDGFERLNDRAEKRAESMAGNLADSKHPIRKVLGWGAAIVVVLYVINLVGGFVSIGGEAIHETQRVFSIKNVREQQTALIEDWQNLLVLTGNACEAKSKPPSANSPQLIESPSMAYAAKVREARVDYNRRQNNLFEAEKVGPPGYPSTIPYSTEMDSANPNWCEISVNLHKVHE